MTTLPDLSHIKLPDGSRPFTEKCAMCYGDGKARSYNQVRGIKGCYKCVGTGYVPLPPERIHEGMLMDALEAMGYNYVEFSKRADGKRAVCIHFPMEVINIWPSNQTRLAALCEAVLKAAEENKASASGNSVKENIE